MRVLFVCSGNICRSPMAEALFRSVVERRGTDWMLAESAGTLRIVDSPAAPSAVTALAEVGVPLERHRSSALDAERLAAVDVAIGMSPEHIEEIRRLDPRARCWLLRAFEQGPRPVDDPPELPDPMGESLELFRGQVPLIAECVDNLARYLEHDRLDRER